MSRGRRRSSPASGQGANQSIRRSVRDKGPWVWALRKPLCCCEHLECDTFSVRNRWCKRLYRFTFSAGSKDDHSNSLGLRPDGIVQEMEEQLRLLLSDRQFEYCVLNTFEAGKTVRFCQGLILLLGESELPLDQGGRSQSGLLERCGSVGGIQTQLVLVNRAKCCIRACKQDFKSLRGTFGDDMSNMPCPPLLRKVWEEIAFGANDERDGSVKGLQWKRIRKREL